MVNQLIGINITKMTEQSNKMQIYTENINNPTGLTAMIRNQNSAGCPVNTCSIFNKYAPQSSVDNLICSLCQQVMISAGQIIEITRQSYLLIPMRNRLPQKSDCNVILNCFDSAGVKHLMIYHLQFAKYMQHPALWIGGKTERTSYVDF